METMCGELQRVDDDYDDNDNKNINNKVEGWESSPPGDANLRNVGGLPQTGTNEGVCRALDEDNL